MLFITFSNDTLNPVPCDICRPGGGRPSDRQEILTCLPATTGVVVNEIDPGLTERAKRRTSLRLIIMFLINISFVRYNIIPCIIVI